MSTYEQAKSRQNSLYDALNVKASALETFPKNEMGLTHDAVKMSLEFKTASAEYSKAFQDVRRFNAVFTKQYKKEIAAERKNKYAKNT